MWNRAIKKWLRNAIVIDKTCRGTFSGHGMIVKTTNSVSLLCYQLPLLVFILSDFIGLL